MKKIKQDAAALKTGMAPPAEAEDEQTIAFGGTRTAIFKHSLTFAWANIFRCLNGTRNDEHGLTKGALHGSGKHASQVFYRVAIADLNVLYSYINILGIRKYKF